MVKPIIKHLNLQHVTKTLTEGHQPPEPLSCTSPQYLKTASVFLPEVSDA